MRNISLHYHHTDSPATQTSVQGKISSAASEEVRISSCHSSRVGELRGCYWTGWCVKVLCAAGFATSTIWGSYYYGAARRHGPGEEVTSFIFVLKVHSSLMLSGFLHQVELC